MGRRQPLRRMRNTYAATEYDFFENDGFFVYYDVTDTCHAIEFTRAAQIEYDLYELFAHPAHVVLDWARARSVTPRKGWVHFEHLGLATYAPFLAEPGTQDERAESLMAFRPGYYEGSAAGWE